MFDSFTMEETERIKISDSSKADHLCVLVHGYDIPTYFKSSHLLIL